jgi:hypothetical protein
MGALHTRSRRCRIHLLAVLLAVAIGLAAMSFWRWDLIRVIYLSDAKNIVLNGAVLMVFAAGVLKLLQAFAHYDLEEKQLAGFIRNRQSGADIDAFFDAAAIPSIIGQRYAEIKALFERRVPIHHGALSAIMVAEQSVWSSFPRFVNNVLILTGVFGTIVSLLFALAGAARTLGSDVPAEGVTLMLSGMNTALNTSVTAMTGFFIYAYFYGRLTNLQTFIFSGIERAVLVHIVPRFAFDTEAINHQTVQLIGQLHRLILEVQKSTGSMAGVLTGFSAHNAQILAKLDDMVRADDRQVDAAGKIAQRLEQLQDTMAEGFRLQPPSRMS